MTSWFRRSGAPTSCMTGVLNDADFDTAVKRAKQCPKCLAEIGVAEREHQKNLRRGRKGQDPTADEGFMAKVCHRCGTTSKGLQSMDTLKTPEGFTREALHRGQNATRQACYNRIHRKFGDLGTAGLRKAALMLGASRADIVDNDRKHLLDLVVGSYMQHHGENQWADTRAKVAANQVRKNTDKRLNEKTQHKRASKVVARRLQRRRADALARERAGAEKSRQNRAKFLELEADEFSDAAGCEAFTNDPTECRGSGCHFDDEDGACVAMEVHQAREERKNRRRRRMLFDDGHDSPPMSPTSSPRVSKAKPPRRRHAPLGEAKYAPGKLARGQDRRMWRSVKDKNGFYRWTQRGR